MVRRFAFFFLLIFFSIPVIAQDITGKWIGVLTQFQSDFNMEINITGFNNGILNGISRFNSAGLFAEMRFTGSCKNNQVTISEYEVAKLPDSLICALKLFNGTYRIDTANQQAIIEGKWTATKSYQKGKYFDTRPANGPFKLYRKINIQSLKQITVKVRPLDGYYEKKNIPQAKMVKMTELREADVVFQHRIWREFDVREKNNRVMASPKSRLIDILMDAVNSGEITAYDPVSLPDDPGGDQFSIPLPAVRALNKLADSTLVNTFDKNGDKISSKMVAGEFNPDSVVRFRLKEDYIFDKQRSVYEYRIIGIAPLIRKTVGARQSDFQPAFWLYFPEVRKVLATKPVTNKHNDAVGLSYDDLFMKRMFTSYIIKESNDKDERIKDQFKGTDRLNESDRIKKAMLDRELGLWQY